MDEIEFLRRQANRSDAPPATADVADRVLATLRRREAQRRTLPAGPLVAVAVAGWIAAAVCGFLVQQALSASEDPLDALVTPFMVVLQ